MYFNSHARVGRDPGRRTSSAHAPDFNSHARVGRDEDYPVAGEGEVTISTHTPV